VHFSYLVIGSGTFTLLFYTIVDFEGGLWYYWTRFWSSSQ